jgi:glycosyltransferase involved in cell wall biosynthesis
VRLVGEVSQAEVRERLRSVDVLLHPSLSEGLPNAVLEAMGCELPVVVTDCGGLLEAVTEGKEGLVCACRSPEQLAAALLELWRDPALRARMGKAGRERVCREFALARQLDLFVALYEELVGAI